MPCRREIVRHTRHKLRGEEYTHSNVEDQDRRIVSLRGCVSLNRGSQTTNGICWQIAADADLKHNDSVTADRNHGDITPRRVGPMMSSGLEVKGIVAQAQPPSIPAWGIL